MATQSQVSTQSQAVPTGVFDYDISSNSVRAKVSARMKKLGARWGDSHWFFPTSRYADVVKIKLEFNGGDGIEFLLIDEFTTKDPEQIRGIVRNAIRKTVNAVVPSLRKSLKTTALKIEKLTLDERDTEALRKGQKAVEKLKDALVVAASFALSEDFGDVKDAVVADIEGTVYRAREEMVKAALSNGQKIEVEEVKA